MTKRRETEKEKRDRDRMTKRRETEREKRDRV